MVNVRTAKEVLDKLRPPLSLSTMRKYFKQLQSEDTMNLTAAQKGEDF